MTMARQEARKSADARTQVVGYRREPIGVDFLGEALASVHVDGYGWAPWSYRLGAALVDGDWWVVHGSGIGVGEAWIRWVPS